MKNNLAKRTAVCFVAACMVAQPAFAGVVTISNTPLGSEASGGILPNLLFVLDDSGSMAWDYNPDFVNDNNTCMSTSNGQTACQRGAPPFEAGGTHGFNQVGYDPDFTYQPGLDSSGQPIINPPSGALYPATSLTPNAYLGGTAVNIQTGMTDMQFCNSASPAACKLSGVDPVTGAVTAAGTLDAEGNSLGVGQFPYRANVSSRSTIAFGMPEMMTTASFSRSGTTVTATTVGKPSLNAGDLIYVSTGSSKLNTNSSQGVTALCVAVATVSANGFTYSTGSSGTVSSTGSYRKCDTGTWTKSSSTVTVTLAGGLYLQSNDLLLIDSDDNNQDKLSSATAITVTASTTFTYTGSTSGNSSGNVTWVRTGLYNKVNTISSAPVTYWITPVEYCADVNLTDCKEVIPPANPVAPYTIPAYVRYCTSQAQAIAPGAVTGKAGGVTQCQLKYVNMAGLTVYKYPRYGRFNRDTITSTAAPFGNRPDRSDCAAAPNCSYQEEIENYARWYAYYRTRMQMMKTSAGRAFLPFVSAPTANPPKADRLRVGFITINPTTPNGSTSAGTNVDPSKYLRIDTFSGTQASTWYSKFYSIIPNSSTPLRLALSRAGWIYAGKLGAGLTAGIPAADDPLQASCQKNYTFLTTDGFWNQGTGEDIAGNALDTTKNQDNVDNDSRFNAGTGNPNPYLNMNPPDYFSSRSSGTFDGYVAGTTQANTTAGTSAGSAGTLADIAMYYYRNDLRGGVDLAGNPTGPSTSPSTTPSGGDVSTNNVQAKTGAFDFAQHQHMNTFTIGLADGLMRYQPDYDTATTGDFANIKSAAAGQCFWDGSGTCNWPLPLADGQSALDDLWHAAVNGRGKFFSAQNPRSLANGLTGALNSLDIEVASAAAAATSSPQVSQSNTKAFSTTYQTATWSGDVYAQLINPQTGDVEPNKIWQAQQLLLSKVSASSDTRNLLMIDPGAPTKLKPFAWLNLTTAEQGYFTGVCGSPSASKILNQCSSLSTTDATTLNTNGSHLVNFLRGQTGEEITPTCPAGTAGCLFRDRVEQDLITNTPVPNVLGDVVNAQPVDIQAPFFLYENETAHAEPAGQTYATFKANNANRVGPLLIAANDGYLHAFDPDTGIENWAYAPKFLMPNLYLLADTSYPSAHQFFVDGTPETGDVFDASAGVWKTIVVGGANDGGRGYYALDVTDPLNPKGLWEFCSNSSDCPDDAAGFSHSDADLGFTYGNPVIGRRASDGRWVVVVTSGLNNTNTGLGYFYVLDAITGQILHKVSTGAGSTTTPSGLMKIGGYYPDGIDDPNFTFVYGGDQLGNVWRMDMSQTMLAYPSVTTGTPIVERLATLMDNNGRRQPITARPAATHIGSIRILYFGTGRYLGTPDLTDPGSTSGIAWQQSIYGIRDWLDSGLSPAKNFRFGSCLTCVPVQQFLSATSGNRTITKNPVDWSSVDGFFIDLNPGNTTPGERIVLDVRLIQGTLIFTSTIPNQGGACVPGGNSFQYNLDFKTGGYVGNLSTVVAGINVGAFLVGAAIEQTADSQIKALNKTITGENVTTKITVDTSFQGKRFSYRER